MTELYVENGGFGRAQTTSFQDAEMYKPSDDVRQLTFAVDLTADDNGSRHAESKWTDATCWPSHRKLSGR